MLGSNFAVLGVDTWGVADSQTCLFSFGDARQFLPSTFLGCHLGSLGWGWGQIEGRAILATERKALARKASLLSSKDLAEMAPIGFPRPGLGQKSCQLCVTS